VLLQSCRPTEILGERDGCVLRDGWLRVALRLSDDLQHLTGLPRDADVLSGDDHDHRACRGAHAEEQAAEQRDGEQSEIVRDCM